MRPEKREAIYMHPRAMTTVKVDGEDIAIGPVIDGILKQRDIKRIWLVKRTSLDHRTLRDFLTGKGNTYGLAGISQIMRAANISLPDITQYVRDQRALAKTNLNEPD